MMEVMMVILIIAVVIFTICPIPVLLLDILLTLNIISALAFLIIIWRNGKLATLCPIIFYFSTISIISINFASTRHILTKGSDFDGVLVRFVSDLLTGHGNEVVETCFFLIFVLSAVQLLIIAEVKKQRERIEEKVTAGFAPIILPERYSEINEENISGSICEEKSLSQKNALLRESDLYSSLEKTCIFISGNEYFRMIIFLVTIFVGMIISIFINAEITLDTASITILLSETANYADTIKIYFYLALGNGLLLLFPILLHSITIGIILKRKTIKKEANNQS